MEENEILYIEHHGREINLRLADGTSIAAYEHIEDILRRLDGCRFFQCHKSYAVNLDAVVSLHGQVFHMIGGASVPVSRSKAAEARNLVTP